ncbi:MAG: hypothetical protein ACFFDW_12515, partial [Candidatus Thorarchaeota archaeon]
LYSAAISPGDPMEFIACFTYSIEGLKDILDELETHIWDKVYEIAQDDNPSIEYVKQAINSMGSPGEIAAEYKRRGKPRFFITEELFPLYTKTVLIIGAILIGLNIIGTLAGIGSKPAARLASGFFSGLIISISLTIIMVTIQFVFLSKEGYLPEDFKRMSRGVPVFVTFHLDGLKKEKSTTQTAAVTENSAYKEEKSVKIIGESKPIYTTEQPAVPSQKYETHVIHEKIIVKELPPVKKIKESRTAYWLGRNYLSEGIIGIVFSFIMIILVFMPFMDFLHNELKIWIILFGVIGFALGSIHFIQALVGRNLGMQQALMILSLIPHGMKIPLLHSLLERPEILYNWLQNILANHIPDFSVEIYHTVFLVVVWVSIGVTILTIIGELIRVIKLSVGGFPQKRVS